MKTSGWFCSSFEPSSSSSTRTSDAVKSGKPKLVLGKRRAKNEILLQEHMPISDDDDVMFVDHIENNDTRLKSRNSNLIGVSTPFVDRYQPHCEQDLAVNRRKVDEVKQWIVKHGELYRGSKLLMLTGPSGCGKSAVVRVICEQLKIELVEWNASEDYEIAFDENGDEVIYEQSQVQKFTNFLKATDRRSIDNLSEKPKVILIEQFPYAFYREPSMFHRVIEQTILSTTSMYIFIMSSVDSCWNLSPKRILPMSISQRLGFDAISFNACASTFLTRALKRIISLMKVNATGTQVKRIVDSSDGDIRVAINNLQLSIDDRGRVADTCPLYSSVFIDPFHCLGKLLYAKRCEAETISWSNSESLLSKRLEGFKRGTPPKDEVSEVIRNAGIAGDMLSLFVHEHEPNFAISFRVFLPVLDNISFFDSALGRWETRTNPALDAYEAEIAARSTVFYNFGFKGAGRGLYTFNKPRWKNGELAALNLSADVRLSFPTLIYHELPLTLSMINFIRPPLTKTQLHVLSSTSFPLNDVHHFSSLPHRNNNQQSVIGEKSSSATCSASMFGKLGEQDEEVQYEIEEIGDSS